MPQFTSASSCLSNGYTVEYINGVSDTLEQAKANAAALQFLLKLEYKGQPLIVKLAYNQRHLAGVGDITQSISQMLFSPISDYDLHMALRQMAVDDTTRKLVLVGHSQGALYANSIYGYLTSNGEPARSVDIYAVATPANYVAGGGKYINSAEDAVIGTSRLIAQKIGAPIPLPPNATITGSLALADLPTTHLFRTYIHGAGEQIVHDINGQLDELQSQPSSATATCFTLPKETVSDLVQQGVFSVVDPIANTTEKGLDMVYYSSAGIVHSAAVLASGGYGLASTLFKSVAQAFSSPAINPAAPENQQKNFEIIKKLYGSSLDKEEYNEINKQGAAAILAVLPATPPPVATSTPAPVVASTSPVLVLPVATTTTSVATSTDTPPPLFIGGSALPAPPPLPEPAHANVASITVAQASSTPPSPLLFAVGAAPPVLTVAACAASSTTHSCRIATTTAILSWSGVAHTVWYGIEANGVQMASTTDISATLVLEDQATTTLVVVAHDMQNDMLFSISQSVVVAMATSAPTPLTPPHQVSPVHDSFDTFNSEGWKEIGSNQKNFDFDDGSDGSCFRGGCVVGIADAGYSNLIPRMSLEMPPALESGAYSVYVKIRTGFNTPTPVITICEAGQTNCLDQNHTFITGIHFFSPASVDNTWHRVYVAWRQGTSHVQSCILQDDINSADCAWVETFYPAGTQFDGVALWSGNGYRNDLGGNVWFDELEQQ